MPNFRTFCRCGLDFSANGQVQGICEIQLRSDLSHKGTNKFFNKSEIIKESDWACTTFYLFTPLELCGGILHVLTT